MAGIADLREAITATGGAASPLVAKLISPVLLEEIRRFSPLRRALPRQSWDTDMYFFNRRTGLPQAQFTTEAPPLTGTGSVAATNSVYVQNQFPIKHLQSNGDVSLFAQKVARVNGSLLDLEIEGAVRAMGWLEEMNHIFGSSQASANTARPGWDGFRLQTKNVNKIDATQLNTNGVLSLPMLDASIDAVRTVLAAQVQEDQYFFVMTPRMQSKLIQLTMAITRVSLERRGFRAMSDGLEMGSPIVTDMTDPGIEVYSYRGIPIVLSSFLQCTGQMGTVTLGQSAGTTPFLATGVRKYVVTAVTALGETLASAEQTITVSAGTGANGNQVSVSWTTPVIPDPESGATLPIFYYNIWESVTAGAETLLAIVPAYDANDAPVTSFIDLGVASVAASGFYQTGASGDGYTYPNLPVAGNPNSLGMENIYLVTRDPNFVVVPVVNDLTPTLLALVNARTRQFAITADETLAVRAPGFISCLERVRFA